MPSTGFMLKGTPLAHFFCTCKLKEIRKTPETWAAMMLVNSVGNAKSVGSIVQSKKNNTTNIIKHLHVYGVFNFKHWPIPDFRLMFFLFFFEKNLEPLQWIGNIISISCTGWPISDIQRGSRFHMIMGWLCQRYQPNSGSFQGWDWWDMSNNKQIPGQWLPPRFAIPQNFRVNVGTVEVS